ncbi:MAG TPA: pitrilysin family protein, partial [Isosphaeraceae bacterium]|nr:pitrilysin family protein [Isosphaeraceae bacterium]
RISQPHKMSSLIRLPGLDFQKITLANGLDVIVRQQGQLPLVAMNLWYHAGSKNEERQQRGFAHLFEHLMFEGSEHYPGDFFKPLQRLGARINGSTSTDRTNYYVDAPAAHLELAMAMESDRMGFLLPALTDAKLRIQKDVVKNEYRQNYANRPYGQVWRLVQEALYPPQHPYSWLTIGVMEDVEAATRDDVSAFFQRFYVPANASLSLVGQLTPDEGFALAERYFGPLPGGSKAMRPWAAPASLASDLEMDLYDRVELDRDYQVWHTVPQFHPDDAALGLLADVLGRGKASRLYRRLVVEEGLAQDVTTHQGGKELAGTFSAVVTLRPGQPWQRARGIVCSEIEAIARDGPRPEELDRSQNGRRAAFLYALDQIGGFGGVADRLNAYNVYIGDPGRITSDLERFQQVTAPQVAEVAGRYLAAKPRLCLTVLGRRAPVVAAPLDRSHAPEPGPAKAFCAPVPHVRKLACGAELWVISRRDLPIVAATAVVAAGASAHGPEQGGLANLTAAMLDEGTAARSSHELALEVEGMGTLLSTSCGWDSSSVSLQCVTPHLDASLDLAVDVLLAPAFPESEWQRVHAQVLAGLKSARDSAEARAHRALLRALYAADDPYRARIEGDEQTVGRLSRDDARQFQRLHFQPAQAAWVVAGDVDPDELAEALDQRTSAWKDTASEPPAIAARPACASTSILLIDRPGAAQAVVRAGHVGMRRLDPDFTDALVLNQILGGHFTSRLNTRLREEKGLTYGVRSQFDFRRAAGPFSVAASVQTERVAEALEDLRHELEEMVGDSPPTPQELDDARRSLIEGQAQHFETPSALVSRYASLFLHGLPPDYHRGFAERLEGVSPASLQAAAGRHLRPRELVAVVVADASLVAKSLEALGWGGFTLLENDRDLAE